MIPLFPELRLYFEAVRDEVNPGYEVPLSSPVITRYRDSNANLRTQLNRIIRKAGLEPWPKLFQNLRSTRETAGREIPHPRCLRLDREHAGVAAKHYLQTTDDHFDRAIRKAQQPASEEGGMPGRRRKGNGKTPRISLILEEIPKKKLPR